MPHPAIEKISQNIQYNQILCGYREIFKYGRVDNYLNLIKLIKKI